VISVGGGLVLRAENVALLRQNGKIIYLRAKQETLEKRLADDDTRPLLQTGETLSDRIKRLLDERTPIYEDVADYIVDVDGKTPQVIAAEIEKNI
jgi:shikimate kinase